MAPPPPPPDPTPADARVRRAAARYAAAPQDRAARAALLRAARRLRRPRPAGDDETTSWRGVLVDPAQVRRLQDEARRSEARARGVLDALPDLLFVVDAEGTYLEAHVPADVGTPVPPADIPGRRIDELLPPEVAGPCLAAVREVLRTGQLQKVEYALPLPGGERRYEARLARCGEGQVAALVRDVTDRHRAEADLREREALLRTTTDDIPGAVYRYQVGPGAGHRMLHVSRGFVERHGLTREQVLADVGAVWALVHPGDAPALRASVEEAARGRAPWRADFRVVVGGRDVWLRAHATPEPPRADGAVVWNGIVTDITELKRLEQELLQSQKLEAVGRLAGGVAHEFNNLLTVILGASEGLAPVVGPAGEADLALVQDAARRGAELVRRLLAFSRRTPVDPRVVDLNAVVRAVEAWARRVLDERIALTTTLAPGPLPVRADAGLLEQALLNLVVNARDALPAGGRIEVATRAAGDVVELVVTDDGVGMPAEVLERCFEPFFTTKPVGRGSGLGLAACRGIVTQFGGTISAASAPGEGATFTSRFPRAEAPVAPAPAPPPDAALAGGRPPAAARTVLVVEDEPSVRAIVAGLVRAEGATVLEAPDGEAALRLAREGPRLDLVITDVVMPNLGGTELALCLRALHPAVPIVFMSGHSEDVLVHTTLGPGVAYLQKPFTRAALRQAIAEVG